jgi:hypothetical protein
MASARGHLGVLHIDVMAAIGFGVILMLGDVGHNGLRRWLCGLLC